MSANPTPVPTSALPTQAAFDVLYWSVQQSAVQAIKNLPYYQRLAKAVSLAAEGYVFDASIVYWGYDPFLITQLRMQWGYSWIPSAGMPPISNAPGLGGDGQPPYDAAVIPPGGIPVTWNVTPAMFPAPAPVS
jgi:hypothetical protein